ncbi:type III PLP-dependent enzyme [Dactylosporangium matsuzakiense]|uniref:Diaminopimelate decarboxylase n=1 Tax=Dactylosporangium matsuzakiense TaxID=53360 RepID=A0A9W6KWF9_9ACTN|nr:type III PLP-dependent enzyme [Dactylosporangium matsuzakiense]GLL08445.1 diaminopimelate decarboxylase [Dactylosporangium matsuzakiense]
MSPSPHVTRAALAGPLPAYLYDLAVVRARIGQLRGALPAGTLVAYAMKANGHPDVVRAAAQAADALEVASAGELDAVAGLGVPLILSGPAKPDALLRRAVDVGAVINVESLHELRRIPGRARICLRVNRAHAALPGTHRMTGGPTQFGIDEADLGAALGLARRHELLGFHLHAVSNNLDAAAHAAYIRDCVTWAAARGGGWVNTGGGFGVDVTGRAVFDLDALATLRSDLDLPAGMTLLTEPGRYVAAPAGWYAAEVVDVKRSHGTWFAVVQGGTHHFRLPASWGYSHPFTVVPVERWPYRWRRPEVTGAAVTVAGEQCNPRDVLARDEPVTRLRAGDVLLFANTGAYGWEVAHHDFLRLDPPRFTILDETAP